jgi:formylglycine-generating enzyme
MTKKDANPQQAGTPRAWLGQLLLVVVTAATVWASAPVWKRFLTGPSRSMSGVTRVESTTTQSASGTNDPDRSMTPPPGMVWIPGGEFSMGSPDPRGLPHGGPDAMADARPIHRVQVDGFWMDRVEVTNRQFAEFVNATGYRTVAERTPTAAEFPGAPPENLVAGSVVFTPPATPVPLDNHYRWWS